MHRDFLLRLTPACRQAGKTKEETKYELRRISF